MERMLSYLKIKVNESLYLKDPESSEVGKRILQQSIRMIDEMGLEAFTFKKLADKANTTESTVYRYFENKHKLLLYLSNWYWAWLDYRMVFALNNIQDPNEKLSKAVEILTSNAALDHLIEHMDLVTLGHLIHSESSKIFRIKDVDKENEEGYYHGYKLLCMRLQEVILQIAPGFPHANSLASTILEGIHKQYFFAEHLPKLTDIRNPAQDLPHFFLEITTSVLDRFKSEQNGQ